MSSNKLVVAGAIAGIIALIVAACGGGGGGGSGDPIFVTKGTVLRNVTVVNTRDGSLSAPTTVIVDNGKIARITSNSVRVESPALEIDAAGKFVVPGFNDMHTHASSTPLDFKVLLANGVTGVREASGAPPLIAAARQQNAAVAAGTVDAPEILLIPSAIFAGQAPNEAAGRQFVRDRKAEGADYIKLVAGARDVVLAIIDEAKVQGTHVAGHLIVPLSAVDSSNAGWRSFEHLGAGLTMLLDCSTDEAAIRADAIANPPPPAPNVVNPLAYAGNYRAQYWQRILNTYSESKCTALAQTLAKNGTWQPLTLIRLRTGHYGDDPAYTTDPNLKYVDKTRVALWQQTAQIFTSSITPASRAIVQQAYAQMLKMVKLMKQNGVPMLAGTDLGGGWVIPGFSLHQEFHELAAAGLTPLQILQMTTLDAAKFLGRESTMGTVEENRNADLVLLDDNPIADAANLDKVFAVVLRGKYYSRAALDKLLADVAAANAAQSLRPLETALDPTHVD
jgi:hypothetical protein